MQAKDRIIVALDVPTIKEATDLVLELGEHVGYFKVGLELLTSQGGPEVVKAVKDAGGKVFYDGKFMDIPNTVAGSVKPLVNMGVDMLNVHCLGGKPMMTKAREAAEEAAKKMNIKRPLILGVTILTGLSYDDLVELGIFGTLQIADPKELESIKTDAMERLVAGKLAYLAQECGLDGVIASAKEAKAIRSYCDPNFLVVTPGIRPLWAATDDQKRVTTPYDAIKAGADFLVIGRPITKPPKEIGCSLVAVKKIRDEILFALAEKILTQTQSVISNDHFVYTSGKHGSEYVNKDALYTDPEATDEICSYFAEYFKDSCIEIVVAPVAGGINLSQGIARHLTKLTGQKVISIYADKDGEKLVLKRGYAKYVPGRRILVVDDVLTTGSSVKKLVDVIQALEGEIIAVGGLCNRGGVEKEDLGGVPDFFTLTNVDMDTYQPEECPLCKNNLPVNIELGKGKEFLGHCA